MSSQSLFWANLLNGLRYLVVWNPIIVMLVQLIVRGHGIHNHPDHLPPGVPEVRTVNG